MDSSPAMNESLRVECATSPSFEGWLARAGGSLMVSTYQAGKVAMIGWDGRQVTLLLRHFEKPLGIAVRGNRIALATRNEITIFANAAPLAYEYLERQPGRYDALYLPRLTYHTSDLHTHDLAFQGEDLLLVNTRFSCLARPHVEHNFVPVWKPGFISELAPEDRCHLNGLAMRGERPTHVTALGATDVAGGWRANKAAGGVLLDVETGDVVLDGLSMPHSPRWHQDRLFVLNSGTGELLCVEPAARRASVVCGLPGYLRGLSFVGPYALVGLSRIRERHIFGGLPIQSRGIQLRCGVAVVDLRSGEQVGMFEFTAGCEELYDIQFLPGVYRPMILNLDKPAAREAVTHPESSWWLRPSAEIREPGASAGPGWSSFVASGGVLPPGEAWAGDGRQ